MKVSGATGAGQTGSSRAPVRAAGGFTLGAAAQAQAPTGAAPGREVTGVASIDALLALQAAGDPTERKRRAVGRASRILDTLDEVKVALLDGEVPAGALRSLLNVVRDQREMTDDPGLEGVLDQIETRAAVELAKYETRRPHV